MADQYWVLPIRDVRHQQWGDAPELGYAVLNPRTKQFASVHLLNWEEAQMIRQEQEEAAQIKENWPDPDDPEVVGLLNDQTFEPKGQINLDVLTSPVYRLHMAAETIARRRAGLGDTPDSLEGRQRG